MLHIYVDVNPLRHNVLWHSVVTLVTGSYDYCFCVNNNTQQIHFLFLSEFFGKVNIVLGVIRGFLDFGFKSEKD